MTSISTTLSWPLSFETSDFDGVNETADKHSESLFVSLP
jgi:hypothetical protein